MRRSLLKYYEVARITIRSRWAYLWDQLLANWFLVIVMFVFVQLWKVTYAATGSGTLAGLSLPEMVWYLVFTEAIVMSLPRLSSAIDQEVKDGDLAIRLNKPYSYLLFHLSGFLGEALLRLSTLLIVGGLTAYLLVGGFAFRWEGVPLLFFVYLITAALHFCYIASIGLLAFWLEDTTGLYFVFDRIKWLLGGMMLPVELFPGAIRKVAEALPFQYMIAGPARLFVQFSWADAGRLLQSQALWLVIFGAICAGIYRLGVRKVDVNGG
jgi:ABC-2 type transport system permease protein